LEFKANLTNLNSPRVWNSGRVREKRVYLYSSTPRKLEAMPIPLENGSYYHIYNRGNNSDNIFYENENYYHFLRLYERYIDPIADTFAWCLLKNHFHILVYIKTDSEINKDQLSYRTVKRPKVISASKQFSHFFNSYTQSINKRHNRTGSLFEKNFERKLVQSEDYFRRLIYYIHNNPVHHGFTNTIEEYPWSSFGSVLSPNSTKLERSRVIQLFDTVENFKHYHSIDQNLDPIRGLIIE
jgi:putative transposase